MLRMREVPAKLFGFMREHARRSGLDVERGLAGLRLAEVDPDRRGERVDWDEVALFFDRIHEGLSDEEIIALGERYLQVNEWLHVGARVLVTPRMLYQVGWELTRPAFPHWEIDIDAWTDPIRLDVRIPDSYRGSRPMMLALVGEMRALPYLVGHSPAEVVAEAIGTHHGSYRVELVEGPARRDQILRRGKVVLDRVSRQILDLIERAAAADEPARPVVPSRSDLQRDHGFTPAEARVAQRLATGASVSEIAREFGVSPHTVRAQLRSMFDKTGARSQPALVSFVLRGAEPEGISAGTGESP